MVGCYYVEVNIKFMWWVVVSMCVVWVKDFYGSVNGDAWRWVVGTVQGGGLSRNEEAGGVV